MKTRTKNAVKRLLGGVLALALALGIFTGTGSEVRAAETITITFSQNGEGGTRFETWTTPTTVSAGTTLKFKVNRNDDDETINGIVFIYCKEEYDTSKLPNAQAIGAFVETNQDTIIASCKTYKDDLESGKSVETADVSSRWNMSAFFYANDASAVVYVLLTPAPATESKTDSQDSAKAAPHTHSYAWETVQEVTAEQDGVEEYRCSCGDVQTRCVLPRYMAIVKGLCDAVKDAPQGGTATFDTGNAFTMTDYLIGKLAERSDVTTVVTFEYQGRAYRMTIPAGADYTGLLADEEYFYGYFYFAGVVGAVIETV